MPDNKFTLKTIAIRAARTAAQTAVALIGTSTLIESVDWQFLASGTAMATVLSVLTSIATGLPEA